MWKTCKKGKPINLGQGMVGVVWYAQNRGGGEKTFLKNRETQRLSKGRGMIGGRKDNLPTNTGDSGNKELFRKEE